LCVLTCAHWSVTLACLICISSSSSPIFLSQGNASTNCLNSIHIDVGDVVTGCSVQQSLCGSKVVDNEIVNVLYCSAWSTSCSWCSVNGHTRSRFIALVGMLEPLNQVIIAMGANGKCLTLDTIFNLISSG